MTRLTVRAGRGPGPGALSWLLALALASTLGIVACAGEGGEGDAEDAGEAAPAGEAEEAAQPAALDPSILDDPTRPEDERAQDEGRQPIAVYEWIGVQPGMTVADVFPGAGYNTHLLSRAVGPEGEVYSVLGFYGDQEIFEGRLYRADVLAQRVDEAGLDNVEVVDELSDLPDSAIDVMVSVRNYHDVEWVFDGWRRADTVEQMYRALKPGGVVGIVEVEAGGPGWNEEAHRLHRDVVIEDFTAGGFEHVGSSEMLDNPDDDHTTSGFEAGRHTMDRYVLKFEKPAAPAAARDGVDEGGDDDGEGSGPAGGGDDQE